MNLILLLSILFIRFPHRFLPVAFETIDWQLPKPLWQGEEVQSLLSVCAGDKVRIVLYVSDHHFKFVHALSIFDNASVLAVFHTQ